MTWWRRVRFRGQLERDLDAELRYHFDRQVEDHIREGRSEQEARRLARLEFGGLDQVKEECRDARGTRWAHDVVSDVRFSARLLKRDRWFSVVATAALGVALAVASTVFALARAVLFSGPEVPNPDRLVYVGSIDGRSQSLGVSYLDYRDWRDASHAFVGLDALSDTRMTIGGDGDQGAERLPGSYVSDEAFQFLDQSPLMGGGFTSPHTRSDAAAVVILGHGLWASRYGGDPDIIGRTIRVDDSPAVVVGVMPAGFEFPFESQLWQPLSQMRGLGAQKRDARGLDVFGLLRENVSIPQARADLAAVAAALADIHPDTNAGIQPAVMTFSERYNGGFRPVITALSCAAVLVLLISCANVVSLLLARSARRAPEISMRLSLGATLWRITRQLMVETVMLAMIAGAIGLLLSLMAVQLLSQSLTDIRKPYWVHLSIDWTGFLLLGTLCLVTGVICALVAAVHLRRSDLTAWRNASPAATDGVRVRRWTSGLVVAELGLAIALLAGAGLLVRSAMSLSKADEVIDTAHLVSMRLALPVQKYRTGEQRLAFMQALEARLRAVPVIASATVASSVPFAPTPLMQVALSGLESLPTGNTARVSVVAVGPRYFETLGMQLRSGRPFAAVDGRPGYEAAIVNERFAAVFLGGADPVGRRIALRVAETAAIAPQWATVVGLSPSVRQNMGSQPNPVVYLPYRAETESAATLIIRARENHAGAISTVREEVRALDSELPVFGVMTMDQVLGQTLWPRRALSALFVVFAGIALVLSAIGLFAIVAYSVSQRTREFGIRMALGARSDQVWWMVIRQSATQTAFGALLGLAGATAVGRVLTAWLVQTSPTDPVFVLPLVGLLLVVALVGGFVPARRATRIDPLIALRE